DRRRDVRVAELRLRVLDGGRIRLDLRFELRHERFLRIDLLTTRQMIRLEAEIALEIALRVPKLRDVLLTRGTRLIERRLKRSRIDACEQLALVHELPFGEGDVLKLPVDAGGDPRRVESLRGAEAVEIHRHVGATRERGFNHHPIATLAVLAMSRR